MNIYLPRDCVIRSFLSKHLSLGMRFIMSLLYSCILGSVIYDVTHCRCTSQIFFWKPVIGEKSASTVREKMRRKSKLKQPWMRGHRGLLCGLAEDRKTLGDIWRIMMWGETHCVFGSYITPYGFLNPYIMFLWWGRCFHPYIQSQTVHFSQSVSQTEMRHMFKMLRYCWWKGYDILIDQ